MKHIAILILVAMMSMGMQAADNGKNSKWYERLVNHLVTAENVDKSVSVNRDPETNEITNATYDFRFTSTKLYETVKDAIVLNTEKSEYYSESGTKNHREYLLRLVDNGRRWSLKLEKVGRNNQFLVRVSTGDNITKAISVTEKRLNPIPWHSKTKTVTKPSTAEKTAAIKALDEELRKAAIERKQKLAQ